MTCKSNPSKIGLLGLLAASVMVLSASSMQAGSIAEISNQFTLGFVGMNGKMAGNDGRGHSKLKRGFTVPKTPQAPAPYTPIPYPVLAD